MAAYLPKNRREKQKVYKKETKTNKRQCPLSPVEVKIREGSSEGTRKTNMEGKT